MNVHQKILSFQGDISVEKIVNSKIKPRVAGLFSGCGGLDLGFEKAGCNLVYANDIEPNVKDTYEHNLGPIEIKDIREVDKKALPDFDILLAGIPCQPFSSAGNRQSTDDHRGNLFGEVMQVLKIKAPSVVIFENVRGFLSSKDENGVLMPDRIKSELKKRGYKTYYRLLNAADYEVPQNRYRVVIVGIKNSIDCEFDFPEPIPITKKQTVGAVISKKPPRGEKLEVWDLSPQSLDIAKYIPPGGSWKQVPYEALPERLKKIRDNIKLYRSPNFYRRFNLDEIMGTVTAAGTPENSGIIHPLELRRYSVREIARFQSFPDSFKFIGQSVPSKYKMIGNAVPVMLAFHIALAIKQQIFLKG
jgi:DNA (cytosine-5)-methyltransferase 1